jgi:Ni,Fe-hydrogenase III component G
MQGIEVSFNQQSIDKVKKQFDALIQELQVKGKKGITLDVDINKIKDSINNIERVISQSKSKLKLFDQSQLQKDGAEIYKTIDDVIKKYEQLGRVTVPNKMLDPISKELIGFSLNVEKADGTIEKLKFDLINIANGADINKAFKLDSLKEADKTTQLREKALNQEIKLKSDIAKLDAKNVSQNQKGILDNAIQSLRNQYDIKNKLLNSGENETKVLKEQLTYEEEKIKYLTKQLDLEHSIELGKEERNLQGKYDVKTSGYTDTVSEAEKLRIQNLGEFKAAFNPTLLQKSNEEIKKYVQTLYGLDAKIVGFKKSVDGAGNSIVKMTVNTKNSKNEIQQETLILDKNTNSIYKNAESIKSNTARNVGFIDRLKNAFVAVTS